MNSSSLNLMMLPLEGLMFKLYVIYKALNETTNIIYCVEKAHLFPPSLPPSNCLLCVTHKNDDLFRILGLLWFGRGNKKKATGKWRACVFVPCFCASSGPGPGAGDPSAEGARASRRAEEETLRAGWGSGGLGRGRRGWGQRSATLW